MVENPPSIAGDAGSNSGQGGKIPCTMRQLSLCSATIEACVPQLKTGHGKKIPGNQKKNNK